MHKAACGCSTVGETGALRYLSTTVDANCVRSTTRTLCGTLAASNVYFGEVLQSLILLSKLVFWPALAQAVFLQIIGLKAFARTS